MRDFNNIHQSNLWDIILLTPLGFNSILYENNYLTDNNFLKTNNNMVTSAFIIKDYMIPIVQKKFDTNNITYRENTSILILIIIGENCKRIIIFMFMKKFLQERGIIICVL